MKKRFLTMLLAVLLVASLVPMAAMADTTQITCWECGKTVNATVTCNKNGTDTITCPEGHELSTEWPCAHPCDHANKTYKQNATGGHKWECECGEKGNWEYCDFSNGGVCVCGRECDCTTGNFVSNNDGTHSFVCKHGRVLATSACEDFDANGKCKGCGYEKPAQPTGTDHKDCAAGYFVCNNDGTHSFICNEHGEVILTTECTEFDENGACKACGYKKTTNPDKPEEKPTEKPAVDSEGLDNVPKTGDNGSLIVVTSMTVLAAIAGAAFVFSKKKAF